MASKPVLQITIGSRGEVEIKPAQKGQRGQLNAAFMTGKCVHELHALKSAAGK